MNKDVEIKRLAQVTLGTILFSVGISFFIVPANLIPGGLTGFATLSQYGMRFIGVDLNLGFYVVLFNIPIMVLGIIGISRTFVYYSIYSIIMQGVLLGMFENQSLTSGSDILAASVLGGMLVGVGAAMTLKAGASTGGIDIVIQYLSIKFQLSIGSIGIIMNAIILGISLLIFDPEFAFYTLLSFFVANMLIEKLHTAYKRVRLDILTVKGDEVKDAIIKNFIRGVTIIDGKGAYTGEHRSILWMITQTHEVYDIERLILEIDPHAFITMSPIHHRNGKFHRVVIK